MTQEQKSKDYVGWWNDPQPIFVEELLKALGEKELYLNMINRYFDYENLFAI